VNLHETDRQKVIDEIAACQERILQTFVPTIISVGLIAIADRETFATITMVCAFAVLFGSSLYVASLSYKIFRNACFIRALGDLAPDTGVIHWEEMLSRFHKAMTPPSIIGYETRTVAFIYMIFALAFIYMFHEIHLAMSVLFGVLLFIVGLRIFLIPRNAERYHRQWLLLLGDSAASSLNAARSAAHASTIGH
jgi:hypothetical protein